MAKVKAEIIVRGRVQKVGYRDYVQEIARTLNVKGYVENQRDGSVKIACEANEDAMEKFIEQIKIKEDLVGVENVEVVRTQPATGEYQYFEIKHGSLEEEMGERMVAALKIAVATRQDIKNMHQDLKTSIVSMHQDMNRHFEEMAKRYDMISAELLRTREELKRSVDSLVNLIQKFLEKT